MSSVSLLGFLGTKFEQRRKQLSLTQMALAGLVRGGQFCRRVLPKHADSITYLGVLLTELGIRTRIQRAEQGGNADFSFVLACFAEMNGWSREQVFSLIRLLSTLDGASLQNLLDSYTPLDVFERVSSRSPLDFSSGKFPGVLSHQRDHSSR
jgi:hypothetical protein